MGGAERPSRHPSRNHEALAGQGSAAQHAPYAALVKLADSLGLGHIFTEQGGGTSAMACDPHGLKRKKGRTQGRSIGGMSRRNTYGIA